MIHAGDRFITKQVDSKKKRKLKKVEDRILGWGRFLFNLRH
jgi:HIV Tat-specific factor 1